MWVSTTGEDSPQCIHDIPTSDPVPTPRHLNELCGSLNYALTHMNNLTIIVVLCGTHELKPLDDSSPDYRPLSNIRDVDVVGKCSFRIPQIHCTNGANLAFYNVESVGIAQLAFNNCGEQLQYSESLSHSSVLYFQDCIAVLIQHINITISGPYGRGISFISYNESTTNGNMQIAIGMTFVSIYHFGYYGSGIHCEVATSRTTNSYLPATASLSMIQSNIQVYSETIQPNINNKLATSFTGINITLRGDGEGGKIFLNNVTVNRNTSGTGISVSLLDNVSRFEISLSELAILERMEKWHNSSVPTSGASHYEYLSDFAINSTNNYSAYSSIQIELRDNSMANQIRFGDVQVVNRAGVTPGNAFSVEVTDCSEGNTIRLVGVWLIQESSSSSGTYRRGLKVILTGRTRRNEVMVNHLLTSYHRTNWGGGAYVEVSGNAARNLVVVIYSIFNGNHAFKGGGGITLLCKDYASQNVFKVENVSVLNSFAELGGGVYLILQDSSNNNTIHFTNMKVLNNTAYCGGGIFISFRNATVASKVEVLHNGIYKNTLLPSEKHDMLGGGVHVEFSTVTATIRTGNIVNFTQCGIGLNAAEEGVGGGISVLYKHSHYQGNSGDRVILDIVMIIHNRAVSGSACAFQSLPTHGKRLFKGVIITDTLALLTNSNLQTMDYIHQVLTSIQLGLLDTALKFEQYWAIIQEQLSQRIDPFFQVQTNTNMIFVKSVLITTGYFNIFCGASSQGIYALGSEIVLQPNSHLHVAFCVATDGGAIALYGESHIRINLEAVLTLAHNHAFQRGGAIYASSAPGVVPVSDCFLQYEYREDSSAGNCIVLGNNSAKAEGESVYVSDSRNCFSLSIRKNASRNVPPGPHLHLSLSNSDTYQSNLTYMYDTDQSSNDEEIEAIKQEVISGPRHVAGAFIDGNKSLTIHFIPGKPKKLPYTYTYDDFGNVISSVFTVLINRMNDTIQVEHNPFSKFTVDFTVILHGIPQQHGMANHSFPSNTINTSAVVRPPQLILQSVDNTDLLLVMNIEVQCCPPGYIFRYGSGDMGTCHCGVLSVLGIAECNESHPEKIGAVLKRDHWAGYLLSNDQHSCDGQKFFTGPCPPGYCQTQPVAIPQDTSHQELQDVVCAGSDRKGLLCGDCVKGKGIAVNFNGFRPVCTSCGEGLSKVGILVWILSEWVPMLAFMFILMLFNIDLVSGRFNSFLLFAQLLAFSTVRGDAELGPVHNAFVRIYRFLYGMWNLDFFGVLLPPFCLAPNANLTLLQTILLHYSIGLFPLTVAITLTVLERSAEKWICCHRVDQCLRRMRQWKAKYSDGMSYDRALPAFVILGFTRFLVSSSYILVNQIITGEDGERKVVVWWQGSVPYGSIQHIAYFIPAIVILLVFVLLPSFVLLTLPIGPQLFGRLLIAVPPLRKLQRIQTFCSNVYTDRWVYHFVNVFQGCYKERFRSFSSLYLFHRIVHLLVAVFIPRTEDALRIQIFFTVALLLLIATLQPYNSRKLNTLDTAVLGNLALILILSLHASDLNTPIGTKQFYASIQVILIYLPLLYPGILLGRKVYLKCRQLRCCQKQEEEREEYAEPLLEAPAERLGNLVLITELRAGVPTSEDDDTCIVTETETET